MDGRTVTAPSRGPGLTWALVTRRAAQGAASLAVDRELINGEGIGLFGDLDLDQRPGDAAFESALEGLHWQLYGQHAPADWLEDISEFWSRVQALDGAQSAWTTVLTVMLRDPQFSSY